MEGNHGCSHKNAEGDEPVALHRTEGEPKNNIDGERPEDQHQVNEAVIHRLVRWQVVACGGRIFDVPVLGHSLFLRSRQPYPALLRVAQLMLEGNAGITDAAVSLNARARARL